MGNEAKCSMDIAGKAKNERELKRNESETGKGVATIKRRKVRVREGIKKRIRKQPTLRNVQKEKIYCYKKCKGKQG